MVDHDIERLDVSVHDAVHVRVLKRLQNHVGVKADVDVRKTTRQNFCLNVGNIFKDECGRLGRGFSQNVVEFDDVGATVESLKDLDLAILLLDAHGLQYLDHALLVV